MSLSCQIVIVPTTIWAKFPTACEIGKNLFMYMRYPRTVLSLVQLTGMCFVPREDRSMLLDCGEGTFLQLVRFFGPKRINTFLRSLKVIYVSHLHADHHIGKIYANVWSKCSMFVVRLLVNRRSVVILLWIQDPWKIQNEVCNLKISLYWLGDIRLCSNVRSKIKLPKCWDRTVFARNAEVMTRLYRSGHYTKYFYN